MDVIDAVATRVAVNRAKSRLTSRFAGAVSPVSGTVIGEGLALVNGQLVNAAVSESQIGETLSLQNAGRAAAAVYVPTAGAGGVAAASSGGGGVVSVPAGSMIPHDLGGSFHIGQLRSDQAEWALMVDGSRMLMGDLAVYAGVSIDGVDLDVHAADPAAHHNPVTVGGGMLLSGQQVSVGAGYGIQVNANDVQLASSVAGAGLTYNAGVVAVGAGYGIQVNADDVQLAPSVAGAGLTYTNGVLAVGAGVLVTVGADSVGITDGSSYQFIGTGGGSSAAWRNLSSLAGDGLTHSAGVLAVGVANTGAAGLSVEADAVRLTSSYDPGPNARVLASDGTGWTTLVGLKATDRLRAPLIDTASGDLTISPLEDLMLAPASNLVKLPSGKVIQSDGYQSQIQGMRVTAGGAGDFRYLFVDELHAKSFITDLEQALAGGQIISKSVAVVAQAFTLPGGGVAVPVRFKDFPSALGMQVFQLNDWVAFRTFNRQNNQLEIGWAWGQVTEPVDNQDGTQTWTWTRNDVTPGLASGTIAVDAIALDLGVSGNGFYEVNAIDGQFAENSPYWRVVTWSGHPATQTVRVQGGNLRGLFGSANDYGFYAGSGVGNSDAYLRLSQLGNELRNIPIRLYNSGALTTVLDSSSGLSFDLNMLSYNGMIWSDNLAGGGNTVMSFKATTDSGGMMLNTDVRSYNSAKNAQYTIGCYAAGGVRQANIFMGSGSDSFPTSTISLLANSIKTSVIPKLYSGATFWTADNDGVGSLLDADKLDGQEGSYYLAASSYTAADVLTKIKTVDGHNSGLDADTLDTYHAASLALKASNEAITGAWDFQGYSTWCSHGYRRMYSTYDVYDHYYPNGGNGANYSRANLRVWNGSGSFKTLSFDGLGSFTWNGNIVYTTGNFTPGDYALLSGAAFSGLVTTTNHIRAGSTGLTDSNSISASNWFRSTGATGWYNQTYQGGIYMADSTWVRTYNNKGFYCNSTIQSEYLVVGNNNGALGGAWTALAVSYGWANYGNGYIAAKYRRVGDVIHLVGMVYCTNAGYGGIVNFPYQIAGRYIYEPPSSVQHCRVDAVPYSGYTGIQTVGGQVLNQWIMLDLWIPIY